jgi:hypothetical protein
MGQVDAVRSVGIGSDHQSSQTASPPSSGLHGVSPPSDEVALIATDKIARVAGLRSDRGHANT